MMRVRLCASITRRKQLNRETEDAPFLLVGMLHLGVLVPTDSGTFYQRCSQEELSHDQTVPECEQIENGPPG
jgi:hypothetical protein